MPEQTQSKAAILMLLAVLGLASLPLFVELANPSQSLALFTGSWIVSQSMVILAVGCIKGGGGGGGGLGGSV